jgi:succinate dehydrogenase flavin-adding protein (antitoxin of CptAB toxin-antitoxin module)
MDKFRIINRGVRPNDQIIDQFVLDEYRAEQKATDYNKLNL